MKGDTEMQNDAVSEARQWAAAHPLHTGATVAIGGLIAELERLREAAIANHVDAQHFKLIAESLAAEVERLSVAAGILQKLVDTFEIYDSDTGHRTFIGIDGDGIFITLDTDENAYLASLVAAGVETDRPEWQKRLVEELADPTVESVRFRYPWESAPFVRDVGAGGNPT